MIKHSQMRALGKFASRAVPHGEGREPGPDQAILALEGGAVIPKQLKGLLGRQRALDHVPLEALVSDREEVEEVPQVGSTDAKNVPRLDDDLKEGRCTRQGGSPEVRRLLQDVRGPRIQDQTVPVHILEHGEETRVGKAGRLHPHRSQPAGFSKLLKKAEPFSGGS